jgi:dolichol-phosphate mannosyltransferase
MKLSIVIPVYNEQETIKAILAKVLREKTPKEVIIIDDASTDGAKEVIESIKDRRVKKLFHQENRGKGAAVRTGFKEARGEILIIQDADLEYDPNDYQKLIEPIIKKKAKVVYGSRLKELKLRFWGAEKTPLPLHYLANRFLSWLTNLLYGSSLTDMETCYKALSREVYENLNLEANRFEIEPEITAKILKKGYQILEVPIKTKPRGYQEGKKIKAKDALLAVWTLFKYRF